MVLELLINPKKIQGKYWEFFLLGFVYSFIAVFLSLWIFKSYASIVMITLTIIAAIPITQKVLELQEEDDIKIKKETSLLKEHKKAIYMFMCLFLGFVFSFGILYVFLPGELSNQAFKAQTETIISINSNSPSGNFFNHFDIFNRIFFNNLKILFFCIVFSVFYGAGAIFILVWNASVMSTAIGSYIRNNLVNASSASHYFQITSLALLRYVIHGIPEIIAYFIGALAGGIFSFALIKHDFKDKNFKRMIRDVLDLVMIAIIILIVAGLLEVYVTPLFI